MPLQYKNGKKQIYFLHQDIINTGKPKYFFSMKNNGNVLDEIPDGFEIYENPNAQVFLRRVQRKIILDNEKNLVEQGIKDFSTLKYWQVDIKKNIIIVFEPNQDVEELAGLYRSVPKSTSSKIEERMRQVMSYSPILRFVLIDTDKRLFQTERFCFLGSIDDWIIVGNHGQLKTLVKKYVKHLGQESFFELL